MRCGRTERDYYNSKESALVSGLLLWTKAWHPEGVSNIYEGIWNEGAFEEKKGTHEKCFGTKEGKRNLRMTKNEAEEACRQYNYLCDILEYTEQAFPMKPDLDGKYTAGGKKA